VLTHRSMSTLDVMVLALLGVGLFEVVLGALRHYLLSHTTHRVDVELGAQLFRHLLHLPLPYFESRRSGDTVARMRELENARNFMTGAALTSWLDLLFAAVFLGVMFYYSVTLTLIVVAALPVFFAASWLITPLMRRKLEDKFALGADNQTFLVETVTSIETLKSHAVEGAWQRDWERRLCDYVTAAFESGHLGNATNQLIGLASKLLTVLLLYFGARLVIDGQLTVGGLIAFNMLAGRVNAPILKLASLWQEFTQMKVSIHRLADIMNAAAEPAFRPGRSTPPALRGRITFEHVGFRYAPQAPEVLSSLNLEIRPGEVVGVTGISGAGKTTLMRLVQRLYLPEKGRILLDGMDLSVVDTSWLRRQIGVVGQDTTLFNRSVRDNIALGNPALGMEAVVQSARLAGAHDFIQQLPDGYDTVIGERGSKLSGGQRARIAIARALVCNPQILLFDEATAALDYESERVIHDNMARICEGRTVLIVAHRLSTLRMADRILVLDHGRLIETGNHPELMKIKGRYASLYQAHQVLEAA
jgi:subfamily B ATP-binding cassette protein HlyB/CyaB